MRYMLNKYIVKYKKNREEYSVFFEDIDDAKIFCKDILPKYNKVEIEIGKYDASTYEEAINILKILKEEINVPNEIFEKSIEICKEILNRNFHIGKKVEIISMTSLYISYRIFNINIKIKKIVEAYPSFHYRTLVEDITKAIREIIKYYNFLIKEFNLNIPLIEKDKFIKEIVLKLNLKEAFDEDIIS